MIDKTYGKFQLICDICGNVEEDLDTFDDAVDFKDSEGWVSEEDDNLGWMDVCTECVDN